ncbi:glycoside hydrolase [Tothia fuscella]|uniref:lytic cellulose monooxygenase (C4-dehydrogenating) n=1 Tax=Tothia fuscella TaxID=1048955 RepID=A0A9P4U3N9_9PEZI|nr:glycoside hydrolase [Tothia fuscella]
MLSLLAGLLSITCLTQLASAHGSLKAIEVGGQRYMAWQINQDQFQKPPPIRYARGCGDAGNIPISTLIPVNTGAKVKFVWDQWGSSHSGPVMTYMARCTPNCETFKGDSGPAWFKIDQMAYDKSKNPPWGSDMLGRNGATWNVTIPSSIAQGEYLRHEILGLHVAGKPNGAQFYPSCTQIKVSGSGTANPKGVALPGAYKPGDKDGILVELWKFNQGMVTYIAPGGPVWTGK